ncbi:MAG TPA: sugar phosphate isomerase/epimerase family protein, partial [bacterium]|nr:sugar phosphate isomerase/epimerase family protein [bacterium]
VNLLRQLGPLAEKRGVTITVEPLNKAECNFITSLGEGATIVEQCDHPNVALLADIYHMTQNGQGPEDIIQFGKHLRHVHIAEKEKRTAPGTMGDDFRPFFKALKHVGYDARISIEGRWDNLANQAAGSIGVLRQQWTRS